MKGQMDKLIEEGLEKTLKLVELLNVKIKEGTLTTEQWDEVFDIKSWMNEQKDFLKTKGIDLEKEEGWK